MFDGDMYEILIIVLLCILVIGMILAFYIRFKHFTDRGYEKERRKFVANTLSYSRFSPTNHPHSTAYLHRNENLYANANITGVPNCYLTNDDKNDETETLLPYANV